MPASTSSSSQLNCSPPALLSGGMILFAALTCGFIAFGRETGLISADPMLPVCPPSLLSKGPAVGSKVASLRSEFSALSLTLSRSNSSATALAIYSNASTLFHSHALIDARRLLKCEGGAKSMGGGITDTVRAANRIYSRARQRCGAACARVGHAAKIVAAHGKSKGDMEAAWEAYSASMVGKAKGTYIPLTKGKGKVKGKGAGKKAAGDGTVTWDVRSGRVVGRRRRA